MLLTKNGVTFEVNHPSDIARLKHSGFVEEKEPVPTPAQEKRAGGRPKKSTNVDQPEANAEQPEGEEGEA